MAQPGPGDRLKIAEAAKYLRISERKLWEYTRSDPPEIPFYRIEGKLFFKVSDLDEWVESHRVEAG